MDFNFNEDQQAFADSAQALFADYCNDDSLRAHDAGSAPYMEQLWQQCVANGLHSVILPEEFDGLGMGMTELMAVLEQQGRALALVPLAEQQLVAATVARYAPALHSIARQAVSAEVLLTLSLDGLRAAAGMPLQLQQKEGRLVLDGVAHAVPLGAQASHALLAVQYEGQPRLVLLDLATPGLQKIEGRSQHHLALADLVCHALPLPQDCLLGQGAQGWLEPRLVAALASLQLGVSVQQMKRTVDYVSERKQFGRVVGSFQLVAGQMADGYIAVEALRSALTQLIYRLDKGLGCAPQALSVKVLAAEAAHLVGHKAQHVHGGIGVDISYPIHRFLYWSRALGNVLGGTEQSLALLGDWLADHDCLGWKYDLAEDLGADHAI
jgi:alkylation response protein AidB-like acyl-CoA dehydrogenase